MGYLRVLNSNIQWCRKSFSLHKCAILIHFGCHFPTVRQPHITLLLLPMMLYHMIYQFSLWFHILGTFKKHTPVLLQILSCRLSRRWVWNCRPWHSRGMRRSSGGSSPIFTGCINHPQMVGLWQVYHRLPQYIFQSIYINWINRKSHWGVLMPMFFSSPCPLFITGFMGTIQMEDLDDGFLFGFCVRVWF